MFSSAGNIAADAVTSKIFQGVIGAILNPLISMLAGIAGITMGATMVLFGIIVMVRNTQTEQRMEQGIARGAQTAVGLVAPETKAVTAYTGASGATTRVTSTRRPARQVRVGGRNVRFGGATVKTDVERPKSVGDALKEESEAYKQTQRPDPLAPRYQGPRTGGQGRYRGGRYTQRPSGRPR